MAQQPFTGKDILRQLDESAEQYSFPMLDNGYNYLIDGRLHGYQDSSRWAIIIETVVVHNCNWGHNAIHNCLHCYGNCLQRPPGTANEDFLYPTSDGPEGQTFEDEYPGYMREKAKTIRIRNTVIPIDVSTSLLVAKGIELSHSPRLCSHELLRTLGTEYRELLLATEAELRLRIPANLPCILCLDEWFHPDLANGELPSESLTFRMIADVLVTGDGSHYKPTSKPNTHWSNWPEGGSL